MNSSAWAGSPDQQFLPGQVSAGEVRSLRQVGLVFIHHCGRLLRTPRLQSLKRILAEVFFGLARRIVISRHYLLLTSPHSL